VVRHQDNKRILVKIVVEGAKKLGQEERAETTFQQKAELVLVFHGDGETRLAAQLMKTPAATQTSCDSLPQRAF